MVATYKIEGLAELEKKLAELGDPKATLRTLRAAVRDAMKPAMTKAQANIAAISPGKAETHRTYKGRLVSAGFAARSLRMAVFVSQKTKSAIAKLGVRREAFYALQFHELGTSELPAQPWLRPAFEASADEGLQKLAATMRRRINRIAKSRAAGVKAVVPRGGD